MKLVSGGQTGVDRAALDAALETGIEAGGWCPEGRIAEDGVIPAKYPVEELPGAGYRQRTRTNVLDSDGTVVIYFAHPARGTKQTIGFCIEEGKPYVLLDAAVMSVSQAATRVREFIRRFSIAVVNVAGPRASEDTRAYAYAKGVMLAVLRSRSDPFMKYSD